MLRVWKVGVIGKAMARVKVLHQVLNPSGAGGVSAEFRALQNSSLSETYEFQSLILYDFNAGVNIKDIVFYYRKIKEYQPDIVHIRGAAPDGLNAVIAARLAGGCKVLTSVHGMYSDMVYYNSLKKWMSKNIIEYAIFSLSHGISCVCRNASDRIYFDRYRAKMLPYVYNRIPQYDLTRKEDYRKAIRQKYMIADNDIICLFVGRMTREKGLLVVEKMLEQHNQFPANLVFLFVGDGDYKDLFEEHCSHFNSRIIFAGMQRDVEYYYMASDFFLQPSLHENHSIALLEACAAGIPSVATDCGGNSEIVSHQKTGLLVPVNDSEALSNAILDMLKPKKLEMFTKNVYEADYTKFSNEECDKALDQVYKVILKRNE